MTEPDPEFQPTQSCNIASWLPRMARQQPGTLAVVFPDGLDAGGKRAYSHLTYRQLDERSDQIAAGLRRHGLRRGMRTVLMVKPSLEFFALAFALFKAGIVPVMIDPGLGVSQLKTCLREVEPEAFIGIPTAHAARVLLGWGRATIWRNITVGSRWFWGGKTLAQVAPAGKSASPVLEDTGADETAAILFTSGSTGIAKGVVYSHGQFMAQVDLIRDTYGIQPGEIDLPTFPLFALFDPALGMTTVVPDMDFTRPAQVDPEKIRTAIEDWGVTNVFASPALLATVGRHGEKHGVKWPTVRRILTAGAPVQAITLERMHRMLSPEALIHTPYGATEVLPVTSISSRDILRETRELTDRGAGVCVGRVVAPNDVRIIEITDGPLEEWSLAKEMPVGQVGEIAVSGPTVTASYYGRPEATRLAKIRRGGTIVHRMGDVGYFDAEGRLWFCGRKSHRVELSDMTLFSAPVEEIFNTHVGVFRTALVGAIIGGMKVPVLLIERDPDGGADANIGDQDLFEALKAMGANFAHTRVITHFMVHPGFPVDIRHNAKIGREKLTAWVQEKIS
ncbi:MAG: AMP-binding protein [Holophagaceae bacterium]|nr:AMP-binding protein [Holophagaceae bacterium]